jgi:hypothetical protein
MVEVVKGVGKYKDERDYREAMTVLKLVCDHNIPPER